MEYNDFLNSWEIYWGVGGTRSYWVRCGDSFKLDLRDGLELSCRIELGYDWYLIVGHNDTKFVLKQNETNRVDF
jgi:hypothetical protein